MKRLLLALVLALALSSSASAETRYSCHDAQVAGACTPVVTTTNTKITATLYAVNVTTGVVDDTATSTSEAVLEYRECESATPTTIPDCPWIRFPKEGDAPITNVNGKGRGFKLPAKTYEVRWNVLTYGAGRINGVVSFER